MKIIPNHLNCMQPISNYGVILRSIQYEDLAQLRKWRNSPEIRQNMLSQELITEQEHISWFNALKDKNECHYIAEYKNKAVGYTNYKPSKEGSYGHTGMYVGEEKYRQSILPFFIILALLDSIFIPPLSQTSVQKTTLQKTMLPVKYLEACMFRQHITAIRFNEKLGYKHHKIEDDLVWLRLTKEDYLLARQEFQKFNTSK